MMQELDDDCESRIFNKYCWTWSEIFVQSICLRTSFNFKIRTNHRPQKWDGNTMKYWRVAHMQNYKKIAIQSRFGEKKEGNYANILSPKIQSTENFLMEDMRRNSLPKIIEICMETPSWCSSSWAPTWWPEIIRNMSLCYKKVNLCLEELKNIKMIFFS